MEASARERAVSETTALETLARIVVDDARTQVGRSDDKALNAARRVVMEAEDRVADLDRAARDIGRTRGEAAESAQAEAALREVATLQAGAFDALFERYARRVQLALEALPGSEALYRAALTAWAGRAALTMEGAAEVFAAKRDRQAVYEALLGTSAEDFHVRVDHRVHVGFVVRDLDGRTLFDARPAALLEAHAADLRGLLEGVVPDAVSLTGAVSLPEAGQSAGSAALPDARPPPDHGGSVS